MSTVIKLFCAATDLDVTVATFVIPRIGEFVTCENVDYRVDDVTYNYKGTVPDSVTTVLIHLRKDSE